jgi:hypothetical protein
VSSGALEAISVAEAALLVAVLAVALIRIRRALMLISGMLKTFAEGVLGVEHDLSQVGPGARRVNAPLKAAVGAMPGLTQLAEDEARHRRARRGSGY